MVVPVGTCYEDAWRYLIKEEEGELIHGTVESLGRRTGHAWVELPTGFIWEPESRQFIKKADFQAMAKPQEEARYSVTEAAIMLARVGKHGPWTKEEKKQFLKRGNPEELVDVSQLKALDLPNVRLAGSYATSRATPKSDIDILIGLTDTEWAKVTPRTPPAVLEKVYSILPEEKVSPMLYKLSDVKDMWFFKRGRMGISGAFVPINDAEMVQGLWNSSIGLKEIPPPSADNPIPEEVPAVPEVEREAKIKYFRGEETKWRETAYKIAEEERGEAAFASAIKKADEFGAKASELEAPQPLTVKPTPEEVPVARLTEEEFVEEKLALRRKQAEKVGVPFDEKRERALLRGEYRIIAPPAVKPEEWKLREAIADTAYGLAHGVKEEDLRKHLTRNPRAKYWFEPEDVDYILKEAKREVAAVRGNPARVRFDRASIDSAIAAAKRLESEKDLYIFATHLGYTIDRGPPPGMQSYVIVHPDGSTETIKPVVGGNPIPDEELDLARTLAIIDSRPKGRIIESKLREEFGDAVIDALRQGRYVVSGSAGYNPPLLVSLKGRELIQGGNPTEKAITKEEAIGMLERLSMTPGEAARSLVADEAERREIMQTVQQRIKREQNKWAPMDPREGPPLPRIFAGLRWPWKK